MCGIAVTDDTDLAGLCNIIVHHDRGLILNVRHTEEEHIITELKFHFSSQIKTRVKLFSVPFQCHSVLYLVPAVTGLNHLKRPSTGLQMFNGHKRIQQ